MCSSKIQTARFGAGPTTESIDWNAQRENGFRASLISECLPVRTTALWLRQWSRTSKVSCGLELVGRSTGACLTDPLINTRVMTDCLTRSSTRYSSIANSEFGWERATRVYAV